MDGTSRREWMKRAALASAGAAAAAIRAGRADGRGSGMAGTDSYSLPVYQVSGADYRGLGRAIGRAAAARVRAGFESRREWVARLTDFMEKGPAERKTPFVRALQEHFPRLLEELEGIAEGADVPFNSLLAVCLNPELSTLMKGVTFYEDCTTAAVSHDGRLWVGHNEDGSCSYRESMYLLDITYPDGARALVLSYPGYWPGNGPGMNSHGLVQTVNYIAGKTIRPGVPRYALDRAILEARNMDQAVALATHPGRAYSQHHLLVSAAENKMVSVETAVEKVSVMPVTGVFVHANHFTHPSMRDAPQFPVYKGSSLPRQRAAEKWRDGLPGLDEITPEHLRGLLADHDNAPLSVCRHPAAEIAGCTLAAMVARAEAREVRWWDGPACRGHAQEYRWPAP